MFGFNGVGERIHRSVSVRQHASIRARHKLVNRDELDSTVTHNCNGSLRSPVRRPSAVSASGDKATAAGRGRG